MLTVRNLHLRLLALLATIYTSGFAALDPRVSASRYTHLSEVNERWLYETGPQGFMEPTRYANEADRITDHLLSVTAILECRSTDHLTTSQRSL